jgi:hypothetical protein
MSTCTQHTVCTQVDTLYLQVLDVRRVACRKTTLLRCSALFDHLVALLHTGNR